MLPEFTDRPPGDLLIIAAFAAAESGSTDADSHPYPSSDAAWNAAVAQLPEINLDDPGPFPAYLDPTTFTGPAQGHISHFHQVGPPVSEQFQADLTIYSWRFMFHSATCYLKVYWDEVTYTSGDNVPPQTTTVPQTWEWTGEDVAGGYCVPANFNAATTSSTGDHSFAGPDPGTWNKGPINAYAPDDTRPADPTLGSSSATASSYETISLAHFRWSFVPGYEPPADGSANGFPS